MANQFNKEQVPNYGASRNMQNQRISNAEQKMRTASENRARYDYILATRKADEQRRKYEEEKKKLITYKNSQYSNSAIPQERNQRNNVPNQGTASRQNAIPRQISGSRSNLDLRQNPTLQNNRNIHNQQRNISLSEERQGNTSNTKHNPAYQSSQNNISNNQQKIHRQLNEEVQRRPIIQEQMRNPNSQMRMPVGAPYSNRNINFSNARDIERYNANSRTQIKSNQVKQKLGVKPDPAKKLRNLRGESFEDNNYYASNQRSQQISRDPYQNVYNNQQNIRQPRQYIRPDGSPITQGYYRNDPNIPQNRQYQRPNPQNQQFRQPDQRPAPSRQGYRYPPQNGDNQRRYTGPYQPYPYPPYPQHKPSPYQYNRNGEFTSPVYTSEGAFYTDSRGRVINNPYGNYYGNNPPRRPQLSPEEIRRREAIKRRREAERKRRIEEENRIKAKLKAERKEKFKLYTKTFFIRFVAVLLVFLLIGFFRFKAVYLTDSTNNNSITYTYIDSEKKQYQFDVSKGNAWRDGVMYINFTKFASLLNLSEVGNIKSIKFIIPNGEPLTSEGSGKEEYIRFTSGKKVAEINGSTIVMEGVCKIINEIVWVPTSFVTNYVNGITVETDNNSFATITRNLNDDNSEQELSLSLKQSKPLNSLEQQK